MTEQPKEGFPPFTQADLDRIIGERLAADAKKAEEAKQQQRPPSSR